MQSTVPPEVWAQIAGYCSTKTLKALSLVCQISSDEALRRLYRSVHFCEGRYRTNPYKTRYAGTRIANLTLFYQSLITRNGCRDAVQEISLEWGNGVKHAYDETPEEPETKAQLQLNDLVRDTANLLSRSPNLQLLHLSLPRIDSIVPFHVNRIDSLKIPITCGKHEDKDPGFATLLKLFQIPLLHRVELDSMLRLCCVVPDSCRQPGTSDVKEIEFIQSGALSEELIDLLYWPKDLQSLKFDVAFCVSGRAWADSDTLIESAKMVNTLSPFKHSIQTLDIEFRELASPKPYPGGAFQAFSKLRRIKVPRELFMEWSDESSDPDYDITPPLHTQLPQNLQELHIVVGTEFNWRHMFPDEPEHEPHPMAKELCAFLSDLAGAKKDCFPEFRELHIWHDDLHHHRPARNQLRYFPLVCDSTRDFVKLLEDSKIDVFFNGISGNARTYDVFAA